MLAAMSFFTGSDAILKIATADLPTGQIMATRGMFAVLIVLGLIGLRGEWRHIRSVATPRVIIRAGMEALIAFLFILCLAVMPLANITAVLQSTPMILTLTAVLLGLESVGWRRWAAIVVGFVGVLLIVQPSLTGFDAYAALTLLTATLVAVRDLITRTIGSQIPSSSVTLTTTVAVTALGFLLGSVEDWVSLSGNQILLLATAALFVTIGNLAVVAALRSGELSVVSPFRYSVILTSLLAGFLVFGEWPDLVSCAGIALIVLSGLYTIRREQNRARSAARDLEDAP
jgi:drug/metabolite transporter (DMT)-like permease